MDFFKRRIWLVGGVLIVVLGCTTYLVSVPPNDFPGESLVSVGKGESVAEVAAAFGDAHIIKHPSLLRLMLRATGDDAGVRAGAYLFKTPQNLFTIAWRLTTGAYGLPPVHLTLIEGETVRTLSEQVADAFPYLSGSEFFTTAKSYEGYLFPDTYFFSPASTVDSIIATMRANFDTKVATLSTDIQKSGHSLSDIVIIASLIEKEARTSTNRHIVAGILWNRLARGMPLQVDAVFGYINNRPTYSPSPADLKIESPYNLYLHKGLPPGPIDNPGLDTLDAAAHPTKTNYLYYLTGSDDQMHYATTYAGHQANLKKYLK